MGTKISSWWREETVEVEWEGVKFLVPTVSFECSEFGPPWHPPVSCTVFEFERVVKENSNNQRHRWWGHEDGIKEIIELHHQDNDISIWLFFFGTSQIEIPISFLGCNRRSNLTTSKQVWFLIVDRFKISIRLKKYESQTGLLIWGL